VLTAQRQVLRNPFTQTHRARSPNTRWESFTEPAMAQKHRITGSVGTIWSYAPAGPIETCLTPSDRRARNPASSKMGRNNVEVLVSVRSRPQDLVRLLMCNGQEA